MTITNRTLIESQFVPITATPAYVSTQLRTTITQCSVYNNNASPVTLIIWAVPNAGAPANSNIIFVGAIQTQESRQLAQLLNRVLEQNASIHWQASTASAISASMSGFVQS
jgi:hypothetical protein